MKSMIRPSRPLVVLAVLSAVILFSCGRGAVRSSPEEILKTIRIPDPSILGYMRADAAGIRSFVDLVETFRKETGGLPGISLLAGSLPMDMILKTASLAREGSFVAVMFLDPGTFGGGAALHFVPRRGESLVSLLEADPLYEPLGGSPPEFRMIRERDVGREILRALKSVGIELEIPGGDFNLRFLVEEDERGVLVLPSYDARRDIRAFLESTGYLSPWGEAGFVLDLDVERLGKAYAGLARSLDRSIRRIAASLDAAAKKDVPMTPGRVLYFWSATVFGFLNGLDGVRCVSRAPGETGAEVRLLAAPGGCVERALSALREDGPCVTGLVPGRVAVLQANADPAAVSGLLSSLSSFYTRTLDLEPGALDPLAAALAASLELGRGRYLVGAALEGGNPRGVLFSALGGGADPGAVAASFRRVLGAFSRLFGGDLVDAGPSRWSNIHCYDMFSGGLAVETGVGKGCSLAVFRPGGAGGSGRSSEAGEFCAKLLRLAGTGVPRRTGFPRRAHVFAGLSLPSVVKGPLAVLGMPSAFDVEGYGRVEDCGRELVLRFPGR